MKNIVLLGSTGFIGNAIYNYLKNNHNVYGYNSKTCNLLIYEEIEFVLSAINQIDVIIFCSSVTRLVDNSLQGAEKNILMAMNLSKFVENRNVKQMIFTSTIDVYGNSVTGDITEMSPVLPSDYYSMSKACSEMILAQACKHNGIQYFVPRLAGIFGVGDEGKSTLNRLTNSAKNNRCIQLYNNGEDVRDFVDIDFFLKILTRAINNEYGGILNIATGRSHKIVEIAKMIVAMAPYDIELIHIDHTDNSRINNLNFDISKLKKSCLIVEESNFQKAVQKYARNIL